MRIDDRFKDCVAFLCTPNQFEGSGFFVRVPKSWARQEGQTYLVTARHVLFDKKGHFKRDLKLRINLTDGGTEMLPLNGGWEFSEQKPALDIPGVAGSFRHVPDAAVRPMELPQNRYAYHELPFEGGGYVTEELIPEWGIGIGDELLIGGLFTEMHGVECNTPIVRSGIIAAMPQKEPLFDFESREWYRGYLAEMRSLGGLSGSPVLVTLDHGKDPAKVSDRITVKLLGLIRSHWDYGLERESPRKSRARHIEKINTGIAIVTPIQEVADILGRRDVVTKREEAERKRLVKMHNKPTLDSASVVPTQKTHAGATIPIRPRSQFVRDLLKATRRREP